jgi:hypothetical protein
MTADARPVGVGLRELTTFGGRLADTEGVSWDTRVDWADLLSYLRHTQPPCEMGTGQAASARGRNLGKGGNRGAKCCAGA